MDDGLLQPDTSFGVSPVVHLVHSLLSIACGTTSVVTARLSTHVEGDRALWAFAAPLFLYAVIGIAFHTYYIVKRQRVMRMQLGPAPEAVGNPQFTLANRQYELLLTVLLRQHVAGHASDIAVLVGLGTSASLVMAQLLMGRGIPEYHTAAHPLALFGFVSLVICTRYRVRRRGTIPTVGANSDFLLIFLYLAAYKISLDSFAVKWTVIFLFAFAWICSFILLGIGMLAMYWAGLRAALWSGMHARVRLGIALAHTYYAFLLVAVIFLLRATDPSGGGLARPGPALNEALEMTTVFLINLACCHLVVFRGQMERERLREQQISAGRVWSAAFAEWNPGAAAGSRARLGSSDFSNLSDENIFAKAQELMRNFQMPAALFRVEPSLWRSSPKPGQADENGRSWPEDVELQELRPALAESGALTERAIQGREAAEDGTQTDGLLMEEAAAGSASAAPAPAAGSASSGTCACVANEDAVVDLNNTNDDDPDVCVICFEHKGDHVLLPCGHGGYCKICAHKAFVKPPHLCPTCRTVLRGIVAISLDTKLGQSATIL